MSTSRTWAWKELHACFGLEQPDTENINSYSGACDPGRDPSPKLREVLKQEKVLHDALHLVNSVLHKKIRENVALPFWTHFTTAAGNQLSDIDLCDVFYTAVSDLHARCEQFRPFINRIKILQGEVQEFGPRRCEPGIDLIVARSPEFSILLKGTLHATKPAKFEVPINAFYARAFQVFHKRQEKRNKPASKPAEDQMSEDESDQEPCEGCHSDDKMSCACNRYLQEFNEANRKLLDLDLLERLAANVLTALVCAQIEKHVKDTCQGSFTASHLKTLQDWLDTVVMRWVRLVYMSAGDGGLVALDEKTNSALSLFQRRLCHHLFEVYTKTRIRQLYNIIIEFPDSQPALEDLRECLQKTDLRPLLTKTLRAVLVSKLLHVGVNTDDILAAYIGAIKALRVLDPSGVILDLVCQPIRSYLRTRSDTVREIVQTLMDSNSELVDELHKNEGLCLEDSFSASAGGHDEEDMENWHLWTPDPRDAGTSERRTRTSDIISMLISIYGSREKFVDEYCSLLSNRLLTTPDFVSDKEIRNLELLKLRFGETALQQCEVMLKDVIDSKRMNTLLHSPDCDALNKLKYINFSMSATILSAQFWPPFKQKTLQLPEEVQHAMDVYTKAFESVKGNRTLVWKNHLGSATLDIEIGDKTINLAVTPAQAAIIYQFQVKAEWHLDELAHVLRLPVSTLRRQIIYWQSQGVLKEVHTDVYQLAEESALPPGLAEASTTASYGASMAADLAEEEAESVTCTLADQREEKMAAFWSYIENMLINLEALPLERIYQMLKMFAFQAGDCDIDELRGFLDQKVREHTLIFSGGVYKLPPKT